MTGDGPPGEAPGRPASQSFPRKGGTTPAGRTRAGVVARHSLDRARGRPQAAPTASQSFPRFAGKRIENQSFREFISRKDTPTRATVRETGGIDLPVGAASPGGPSPVIFYEEEKSA